MGRKFFVCGNWKCNGTVDGVKKTISTLNAAEVTPSDVVEVVVSPTFVFLELAKSTLRSEFQVAAQNCWVKEEGSYTGEVSAEMLVNLGVPWVISGHSERRVHLGETNEVAYALSRGLKTEFRIGLMLLSLAYEPFWAIGAGSKVASPAQVQEVHSELRKWLHGNVSAGVAESTRIIYGGSVNAENCKELGTQADVDGFLVGRSFLKPEFTSIINPPEMKKKVVN